MLNICLQINESLVQSGNLTSNFKNLNQGESSNDKKVHFVFG